MERQQSQQQDRQRKFLTVLPLLAVPFLTLMFWALGGGKSNETNARSSKNEGINMTLPDASFGKENLPDKMSYYDHASSDSARLRELIKNDPYYSDLEFTEEDTAISITDESDPSYTYNTAPKPRYSRSANEAKVYQKLAKLDEALKNIPLNEEGTSEQEPGSTAGNNADIDRLEQMMHSVSNGNDPDPEMQQIDGMLERILDIQHPERVTEKLRQRSEEYKGLAFAVTMARRQVPVTLLTSQASPSTTATQGNAFFSLDDLSRRTAAQNTIEAVIHENQTVVNGSTVKLRLLNEVYINGVLVQKDHFIYGVASLKDERLQIAIRGIRSANNLFTVALSVYDLDGLPGIYVPGAITRDVAKQSADRSVQSIGFSTINPSWQTQAAGAGVEAAKTLFSKKVKLVKVTLKAGYRVLLFDEKQKDS